MELQFVLGNPGMGPNKKSKKKKVAKLKKGKKNNNVHTKGKAMAKRKKKKPHKRSVVRRKKVKTHRKARKARKPRKARKAHKAKKVTRRRRKRTKNPYHYVASKTVDGKSSSVKSPHGAQLVGETRLLKEHIAKLAGQVAYVDSDAKMNPKKRLAIQKQLERFLKIEEKGKSAEKSLQAWSKKMKEDGYDVAYVQENFKNLLRVSKSKPSSRKKKAKGSKKKTHKKGIKVAKRAKRRKAKKVRVKGSAHLGKKTTSGKIKVYKRLGRHKSASKHLTVGGKKFTVKVSRNPIFGAPRAALNVVDKQIQLATGHELKEVGLLMGAGAALPVIELGLDRIFKAANFDLKSYCAKFGPVAAQASSSLCTILLGGAAHYAIAKTGKGKQLEPILRALLAAAVVQVGSAFSGTLIKASGLSGVNFTPMSGVNFTPMSGVQFTPMAGVPQLGRGADFGSVDYGGGAGYTDMSKFSKSDFGKDDDGDEEPILDQSQGMGII